MSEFRGGNPEGRGLTPTDTLNRVVEASDTSRDFLEIVKSFRQTYLKTRPFRRDRMTVIGRGLAPWGIKKNTIAWHRDKTPGKRDFAQNSRKISSKNAKGISA